MPGPSSIHVGVVASHSLAKCYLCELIAAQPNLLLLPIQDTSHSTIVPLPGRIVIVIDLLGTLLPITEHLDRLAKAIPHSSFLATDGSRMPAEVVQLLKAGFSAYLSHDEVPHQLANAIVSVANGGIWASPQAMQLYVEATSRRSRSVPGAAALTVREHQILELLRRRYSNREVAELLGISESTVKFHVSNVLTKLNVRDRRALATHHTILRPSLERAAAVGE